MNILNKTCFINVQSVIININFINIFYLIDKNNEINIILNIFSHFKHLYNL